MEVSNYCSVLISDYEPSFSGVYPHKHTLTQENGYFWFVVLWCEYVRFSKLEDSYIL
jgi:hypothetical protein